MSPHALSELDASEKAEARSYPVNDIVNRFGCEVQETSSPKSRLQSCSTNDTYDLICVGFGPASLAIAIALHDAIDSPRPLPGLSRIRGQLPKVLFLERQSQFGWHTGMLLPGARMQISFVKDLATMRNPRSEFTFLNYLHCHDRLAQFTNLDTFLPHRIEYEDYMKWCATSFEHVTQYGKEVTAVSPESNAKRSTFQVTSRDTATGELQHFTTKHVVLALGGKPQIPAPFPQNSTRVIHSSCYARSIGSILKDKNHPYSIAVVGSGQSAAEIFNDLHSRYPNARTRMFIRGAALKPSDDSPFVNEIFDPSQVDDFYSKSASEREASIRGNRSTNYGVVRGELLQHIYDDLYMQRIKTPREQDWQHRVLKYHAVVGADASPDSVKLSLRDTSRGEEYTWRADVVIVAAGYSRDTHETILDPVRPLTANGRSFEVERDYRLKTGEGMVTGDAGIWLQGCNESTHGLSDTLLSILATRGGDMVKSIFGDAEK